MPEGDTIFRAARTLNKALGGKVVTKWESVYPALNRVDDDAPIAGRTLLSVESRGKHLLMHFSGELALRTHLRMSGSWHIYRPAEPWQRPRSQLRILIETADFVAIAFSVHEAEWLQGAQIERSKVGQLGPDILGAAFDPAAAVSGMRARPTEPICDVLLDQRALAGIGNVYKSELLFLAGVHPLTTVAALDPAVLLRLAELAAQQLRANVHEHAAAGITTYRGLRRTTRRADPGERLWVYGRGGQPCRRCGTPIVRSLLGKHVRSTYHCPQCQVVAT
jgi:endonuclease VIII